MYADLAIAGVIPGGEDAVVGTKATVRAVFRWKARGNGISSTIYRDTLNGSGNVISTVKAAYNDISASDQQVRSPSGRADRHARFRVLPHSRRRTSVPPVPPFRRT